MVTYLFSLFLIVAALISLSVNANAQGYVTVGNDTAQYTQFSDAYNVGGAEGTYTIHAGMVPVGSAISSGSATKVKMTVRSDNSGTEHMIDLSQNPGNRFLAVGEDASMTVTGTTLMLNSIHFFHGASMGNGGVIYANSDLELRGVGKFSTNRASQYGGAIYLPNHALNLTGDGSELLFFNNSDKDGSNDIAAQTVTISGAGNYYFGGGIDAQSLALSGGANAVFTSFSSSTIEGPVSLTDSILTIQRGDSLNFSANSISADQNSLVLFEYAPQATTEIMLAVCNAQGLNPSSAMAALTGENTDNVAFISSTDATNVVTSLQTDGLDVINQFSKKNSSSDNGRVFTASAGSFGDFTSVSQDDLFIFSGDANFGATYSSDVTDLTLSFQSNHADYIRTLTAGTMWAPQQFDLDKTNATLKTYNMRFDGRDTAIDVNGGAINAKNVNLIGTGTEFSGFNISENNGGVIYVSENVKVNGEFIFKNNDSSGNGGAIYAENDVDILGTNAFSSNRSGGMGGAIYAGNDVSIRGTNAFSYNEAGAAGGAISGKTITLSGKNAFRWNSANGSNTGGGAIYADSKVTFNAGDYLFQGNIADNKGGAIHAAAVEFKSDGNLMNAKFTGNAMAYGSDKNDIYTTGSDGVQFNGAGTYSFDGGIRTQALTLSDGADVTLEAGSVTRILPNSGDAKLTLSDGARLNIVLNNRNQYESVQDTPVFELGATQFTAAGVNMASDDSVLRFVVDNAVEEKYYLGAIGDFTAINGSGMVISQINGGEGIANIVTEKLGSAVWLDIEKGDSIAVRKSSGVTTQNKRNIFNDVFEPGPGEAFASQDVIYLAGNINASDKVYVGEGVTSFGVISNSVDAVRKITATNDNRFFNIVNDATVTFDNLTFSGGKSTNDDGGAIWSNGSMLTLRSLNNRTTFQDNSAECGGAIEADELILDGKYLFSNNTAIEDGGAIDVWDVTIIGENYFDDNHAADGGAIWAKNVNFEGYNSKAFFTNNTATGKGADVFINSSGGSLTFKDNGLYSFGGGVYDEGTAEFNDSVQVLFQRSNTIEGATTLNDSAQVIFADQSKNTLNDLTINDSAHIKFNMNSENTMADMLINDSSQVLFASGSQNTMADMIINDSSQIAFGINALATINGMTTLNVQQVEGFAHRATLNFNGGLTISDGVKQKFNNANVTIANALVITYGGASDNFDAQADFKNVNSLSIADNTKFVICDTNGKTLTGKDFIGKVLGNNQLVIGPDNSTELEKIILPEEFNYETRLYSVTLENFVLKSVEKSIDIQAFGGNVSSAVELSGKEVILDVPNDATIRSNTNALTGELFVNDATLQTRLINSVFKGFNELRFSRFSLMNRKKMACGMLAESIIFCSENETPASQNMDFIKSLEFGLSYSGQRGEVSSYRGFNGYDYDNDSVLVSASRYFEDSSYSFSLNIAQTKMNASSSKMNTDGVGFLASYSSLILDDNAYYNVSIAYQYGSNDMKRYFMGNTFQGSTDTHSLAANIEFGEDILLGDNFIFNRYVAMNFNYYIGESFADEGLFYDKMTYSNIDASVGLRIKKEFMVYDCRMLMSIGGSWTHLLDEDKGSNIVSSAMGKAEVFGNNGDDDFIEGNIGLTLEKDSKSFVFLGYRFMTNHTIDEHSFNLSYNTRL